MTSGNKTTLSQKLKGELQRPNKLISLERPFKILQNETKIIKIGQAVLEIFNVKDRNLDNFREKNDKNWKFFLKKFYTNWRTIDCVTSEMINTHISNKQSRIFPSVDLTRRKNFMDEQFDTSEIQLWYFCCYYDNYFRTKAFYLKTKKATLRWNAVIPEKNVYRNWNNMDYLTHWVKSSRLNVYQWWSTSSLLFLLSS